MLPSWISPLEPRLLFAAVPAGFTDIAYGAAISTGTAMDFAPDGRLFVLQQTGQLRIISGGSLIPTPALSLTVDSSGERGLLGIAFDPNFAANQYIYLYYTTNEPTTHNRISRLTMSGDTVVAGSEVPIFELDNLSGATNHNGGAIHFGVDGKLYVAVGENANAAYSQSLNTTLGKILRINADGSIPTDNPFYNATTGNNRAIWAWGLRNPFTFAVQPGTGTIAINDVGQSSWEEVNIGAPGANYGWSQTEGDFSQASFPNFTRPRYSYDRNRGAYITGGAFYNPAVASPFPLGMVGQYFFQDGGSGTMWRMNPSGSPSSNNATSFATGLSIAVDLKVGPDGFLYYLQRGSGNGGAGVRRISTTPVSVTDRAFVLNGASPRPQMLRFVFDRDIGGSQSAQDLVLTNLDTNTPIPASDIDVVYTPATRTLDFHYTAAGSSGIFPDGRYRALLPAGAVDDGNDIPTTQNAQFDFFILAGDATRDHIVDTEDFNILAANFGDSGRVFTDGDFDYSTIIDSSDFDILVSRFGKRVDSPAARAPSPLAGPALFGRATNIDSPLSELLEKL